MRGNVAKHGTFIFVRDWLILRRGRGRGPVYEGAVHAWGYWSAARLGMEGRCQQAAWVEESVNMWKGMWREAVLGPT